jgi:acyl-[acyl carrier protein]--UDP-N-acetylglucosamine O-acyltransferase
MYRILFQSTGAMAERLEQAAGIAEGDAEAMHMLHFAQAAKRGMLIHRRDAQ